MAQRFNCRICGLRDLESPHGGSVDCINYYRAWVNALYGQIEAVQAQLPKGREILGMPVSREGRISLWLDGRFTPGAFDRMTRGIEILRDLFDEEESESPRSSSAVEAAEEG